MKIAIFDDHRCGVVIGDEIIDVTSLVGGDDRDPFGAGWWVRMVRDFDTARPDLEQLATSGKRIPLTGVQLRPAVLNPSKVIAAAANYAAHVAEGLEHVERLGYLDAGSVAWMKNFGVFLKATSSIVGPDDDVLSPQDRAEDGIELHHESELAVVIGRAGADIAEADALDHVFGYTIGIDVSLREPTDRSFRKSFDTFTPVGPWVVTADEIGDPHDLQIQLDLDGERKQDCNTADLLVGVPGIISYASRAMTLYPGDVILTGAPPGVGPMTAGQTMTTTIDKIGTMRNPVRLRPAASRWVPATTR